MIQSLAVINYPDYSATNWQGTLLVFASVAILYIMNVYGSQVWSKVQNVLLFLHVAIFLVFIIVLAVRAPHQSAKVVLTKFTNEGGWSTTGLALMVGQITAIYSLIGKPLMFFNKQT